MNKQQIIITGAARGIGAAIAKLFYQKGYHVLAVDREKLNESLASSLSDNTRFSYYQLDLCSLEAIQDFVTAIDLENKKNNRFIKALINNAGVTRDKLAARVTSDDWDVVMNSNLRGAFFLTQRLLRLMTAQKNDESRSILMMSSIVAHTGNIGQSVYAASKAALIALAKSLALEYASRGIRINALAPGFVDTPMTQSLDQQYQEAILKKIPLGRAATIDEIAQLAFFLCSENARYITGQCIDCNGGLLMR